MHAAGFAIVMAALGLVWLVTGAGALWPQWVLLSWGAVLAVHAAVVAIDARPTRLPRALALHAATSIVVMGALVGVWTLTGGGLFWPRWPLVASATLLAGHGWAAQLRGSAPSESAGMLAPDAERESEDRWQRRRGSRRRVREP